MMIKSRFCGDKIKENFILNSRRQFIQNSALLAAGSSLPVFAADALVVGGVLDLSGPYDYYGMPMARAGELAIAEINDGGGLLGREVRYIQYDGQSTVNLYELYGRELLTFGVAAAHGGVLPEERRALFSALRRQLPYFSGAPAAAVPCGEGIVASGATPAQQLAVLIPEAAARFGGRAYVLASDSPYGRQTAEAAARALRDNGAELAGTEFVPFSRGDFRGVIGRIRDAAPDMLLSALIGKKHLFFYKQWKESGLKEKIPVASTTFGVGGEQQFIPAEDGDGILVAHNYAKDAATPENEKFIAAWKASADGEDGDIHEVAVSYYQGLLLWAAAVRAAGASERAALMREIGGGRVAIDAPSGRVSLDGKTNRAVLDIHLMRVDNRRLALEKTFPGQIPADARRVCAEEQG